MPALSFVRFLGNQRHFAYKTLIIKCPWVLGEVQGSLVEIPRRSGIAGGFKRDNRLFTSTPQSPLDEHSTSLLVVSKTRLYYTWLSQILLVITPGNGRRRGGGQHTTPFHSVGKHLKMPQNSSRLLGGCRNCNKVRRWICFSWPVLQASHISNDNVPKRFSLINCK